MAAQISHALVGQDALALADPRRAGAMLDRYGAWFRLGCQGPDIFYHNQRTRPLSVLLGSLIHRRGAGSLAAALLGAATLLDPGPSREAWLAYCLGFVSHIPLDRLTHPYIVHRAGWVKPKAPETDAYRSCHPFLERILDALYWEARTGGGAESFRQSELLLPPGGFDDAFIGAYSAAIAAAYPERYGRDAELPARIANAWLDASYFYARSDPSRTSMRGRRAGGYNASFIRFGYRAVALVYPEDFSRETDWANDAGLPWTHPCEPARSYREGYAELCAKAAREAAGFIGLAFKAADEGYGRGRLDALAAAIGDATLNVGAPDGTQAPAVYMDPLPLKAEMERQFERRVALLQAACGDEDKRA